MKATGRYFVQTFRENLAVIGGSRSDDRNQQIRAVIGRIKSYQPNGEQVDPKLVSSFRDTEYKLTFCADIETDVLRTVLSKLSANEMERFWCFGERCSPVSYDRTSDSETLYHEWKTNSTRFFAAASSSLETLQIWEPCDTEPHMSFSLGGGSAREVEKLIQRILKLAQNEPPDATPSGPVGGKDSWELSVLEYAGSTAMGVYGPFEFDWKGVNLESKMPSQIVLIESKLGVPELDVADDWSWDRVIHEFSKVEGQD